MRRMAEAAAGGAGADAFASQPIAIGAHRLIADKSGALFWPAREMLVVADLHLEKGSSFAERGTMLPPYDTRDTLLRLAGAVARYRPETIIALGDSLHDPGGARRLGDDDRVLLEAMVSRRRWVWITGNHDGPSAGALGGTVLDELVLDGVSLRHEPDPASRAAEIAGHLHPAARIAIGGRTLRRPCFVATPDRLVLPAFGTFTGGLNVLDPAFAPLLGSGEFAVRMLGADGLYPIATQALLGD